MNLQELRELADAPETVETVEAFYVAARTAVPALLDALEEAQRWRSEVIAWVEVMACPDPDCTGARCRMARAFLESFGVPEEQK